MRKLLPAALVLVVFLAGFPLFALLAIVTMSSQAAATCQPTAVAAAGDVGRIGGPVGGPVTGSITMATANIPARVGLPGFNASMPRVLSMHPDVVALQEVGHRTLVQIEAAAPGYTAYRDPTPDTGHGSGQAMNNVVLFNNATWSKANAGRVKIVGDDQAYYDRRPVTWDRYATWVMLQRRSDGAVVSVVSVHQMTNPKKYPRQHGNPPQSRAEQYGQGMDTLLDLVDELDDHGPVLIGGDLNTPASYQNLSWSAAAKMTAAGYAWATHGVDFVFFPRTLGVRLAESWTGAMRSDHQWVAARLDMNGAGPSQPSAPTASGDWVPADGACAAVAGQVTLASFNILGASHTDGKPGSGLGGGENHTMPSWDVRLPKAMALLESAGVTIAGLQEVHRPQSQALASAYADRWGMFPANGLQNKVIWDRTAWRMTDSRLVDIPYHYGHETPMPLVQLTSTVTGQVIWVWSIHNPIGARLHRVEALRRQHATLAALKATGTPVVIVGDFNDGHDGDHRSHCTLTPTMANAFGGQADPCRPPKDAAPIDHIYGANLAWAAARVDRTPQRDRISDHPLVVATTAGSDGTCPPTGSPAEKGLTPDAFLVLRSVQARFGSHTYIGVGDRSNNPDSDHPSGRAVDVMIDDWDTPAGIDHGTRIAAWVRGHAPELGVTYIIWRKQIWSTGDAGWRPYTHPSGGGGPTLDHLDHVHVSVAGTRGNLDCGTGSAAAGRVVYPVPVAYDDADRHNWHATGSNWSAWHTGTDFSAPCGAAVYAAHAGTVEIDTTQAWAGTWLVKVTTGPSSVATWYAHMQSLDVARGQRVAAGQRIGAVGARGNATGCHLHFEVHLKNGPIYGPDNTDPSTWLAEHATRTAPKS